VSKLTLKLDSGSRRVEVADDSVVLGRDAAAQVVVQDRSVSRRHARIERRGDVWFVVDQESSNGTFLDGKRVTEAPLCDGQELRLGVVALGVEIEAPEVESTVLLQSVPRGETATTLMPAASGAGARGRPAGRGAAERQSTPATRPQAQPPRRGEDPAKQTLLPFDPNDLPADQPVVVADALESVFLHHSAPAAAIAPAEQAEVGLHPVTRYFGSAAIVLASLALFFLVSNSKNRDLSVKLQRTPDLIKAQQDAATYHATRAVLRGGALDHQKLAVCNVAAQPLRLAWLGAVDVDIGSEDPQDPASVRTYKLRKFHSGYCAGAFDAVIPPGEKRTFSFAASDERCRWQGAAVFYGFTVVPVSPSGSEKARPMWYAGVPGGETACVKVGSGS
jgi:pSer/pThr/pTyr-binding forkhead associated (FHA) protein